MAKAREVITSAFMNAGRIHGSNTSITVFRDVARYEITPSVDALREQFHEDTGEHTLRFTATGS
jgi:hypothetical protein